MDPLTILFWLLIIVLCIAVVYGAYKAYQWYQLQPHEHLGLPEMDPVYQAALEVNRLNIRTFRSGLETPVHEEFFIDRVVENSLPAWQQLQQNFTAEQLKAIYQVYMQ